MVRVSVSSSDVASLGYEQDTGQMEVTFHSGAIYVYYEVSYEFFESFLRSPSKGQFANYVLKRAGYAYDRVA